MKHLFPFTLLIIMMIFSISNSVFGQYNIPPENETWVTKMDSSSTVHGYIRFVGNSTLTIMNKRYILLTQEIPITSIKTIKFRKRNKVCKSIIIGALTGVAVGAIVGLAVRNDSSCDPNTICIDFPNHIIATKLAGRGAIIGGLVGALIGHTMSFKIPINGKKGAYESQKEKLKKQKFLYYVK